MTFKLLWLLAFLAMSSGALFQLVMQPELKEGAMSFAPDISRIGELLQGPGRLMGHMPVMFVINAAILSAIFAVIFCKENKE